ncbi:MAG: hypothetical protein ABJA79_05160 [Parafilimonas sp.]
MRHYIFIIFLFIATFSSSLFAQRINSSDHKNLQKAEDSLKVYAKQMIFDADGGARFRADTIFIKSLVKALQTKNSFYYPFDSIITVSKMYAPDSSFRIFSWQIEKDESYFRQYGAIQMNIPDGSLKLFPLIDMSDFTATPADSVRNINNWIGAIYYGIVIKEFNGKKFYTLLGFDDNDFISTKKWIEVINFNNEGNPVFGGRYFQYANDSIKPAQPAYRFCLEYKKDARARMVFDPDLDMIVFDHLISETNEPQKKFTLIPDGDYEGFKWQNGKWVHVEKVFEQKLKNGEAPLPQPFYDENGKPIQNN